MWLLDTTTLKLRHFINDIPNYVILSHTWGDGEVGFEDIAQPYAKDMAGYSKISRCCAQAVKTGFEWAWVDTCCIDKRSSAELSEAINSMYKWYWNAAICYVHMSDFSVETGAFESSRWFKRGWTLQELLAPEAIEFYDSDWDFLGTKSSLIDRIFAATSINKIYLLHRAAIEDASIAAKFSWASTRETTREEDMAYCLLGLVQVNMPMLYGEGSGAFYRLQLEIIKQNNDHTIFAWEDPSKFRLGRMGMFASSPALFAKAADFRPHSIRKPATHEMTNFGLKITIPCTSGETAHTAILECSDSTRMHFGIRLASTGTSTYKRVHAPLIKMGGREAKQATPKTIYIEAGSRNSYSEIGKAYSMRVYNMADPARIRRIATGTFKQIFPYQEQVFYEEQGNHMRQDYSISTLDRHMVMDGAFVSFVYEYDGVCDPLIFLGLDRGRPWIYVSSCIPARWIEEVEKTRKLFATERAEYSTDHSSFSMSGGRMLEALARKISSGDGLQWRVDISME